MPLLFVGASDVAFASGNLWRYTRVSHESFRSAYCFAAVAVGTISSLTSPLSSSFFTTFSSVAYNSLVGIGFDTYPSMPASDPLLRKAKKFRARYSPFRNIRLLACSSVQRTSVCVPSGLSVFLCRFPAVAPSRLDAVIPSPPAAGRRSEESADRSSRCRIEDSGSRRKGSQR
jgi:hypothetical protein